VGIGPEPQQLLRDLAAKLPARFSVCELGDQLYATTPIPFGKRRGKRMWERAPAVAFYKTLGCGRYESIDANGNGTVLADLNLPLDEAAWTNLCRFDLVTNVGTTEHVFNLAQCWRTIHDLTAPGGYIFAEQPTQGYPDHGFYNLQPTFVHDLARHNSYKVEHLDCAPTPRGTVMRFIYRRTSDAAFEYPTQGRYRKRLKL
jgi:SAM-dependent methyltransferase